MAAPRRLIVWRALAATPSVRDIPSDDVIPTLIAATAERIGRPIQLESAPLPARISAAWSSMDAHELIEYADSVPPSTAFIGILHELGHMLCGHSTEVEFTHGFAELTPSINPELAARLLRRNRSLVHLPNREEAEAELYARIMYRRALRAYSINLASPGNRAFNLAAPPWAYQF